MTRGIIIHEPSIMVELLMTKHITVLGLDLSGVSHD